MDDEIGYREIDGRLVSVVVPVRDNGSPILDHGILVILVHLVVVNGLVETDFCLIVLDEGDGGAVARVAEDLPRRGVISLAHDARNETMRITGTGCFRFEVRRLDLKDSLVSGYLTHDDGHEW